MLGFSDVGFSGINLEADADRLQHWLEQQYHGSMSYMQRHGSKRHRPAELVPETLSVISVRLDYLTDEHDSMNALLDHTSKAYVSRYALGRDYHKLMRKRLAKLAQALSQEIGDFSYRAFVDSAPVMEKPLARDAGLGWIGKHTNLLNKNRGSWFFLGELYTDLPFSPDQSANDHCGSCTTCMDVCPTRAIVAPYQLDARKCISYLTIENDGAIPVEFRRAIGNRIYGCDDCQLFCPWNKFAQTSKEPDFKARHGLNDAELLKLFRWTETQFLERTEGSPIRRIGYRNWQRNIAVALGNAATTKILVSTLEAALKTADALLREHVQWALQQHETTAKKD
ncbi:MAG: tRNA epoxyqueuosine(34) reductase QueG [Pseudomonadota bacterium]